MVRLSLLLWSQYHASAQALIDFWELPTPQLTSTLTTEVERNFYARCPPEKRPKSKYYESTSTTSLPDQKADAETGKGEEAQDATLDIRDSTRSWFWKWPKIKSSLDGQNYDSSLIKALHKTFFTRWWIAGLLKLIAGALIFIYRILDLNSVLMYLQTHWKLQPLSSTK